MHNDLFIFRKFNALEVTQCALNEKKNKTKQKLSNSEYYNSASVFADERDRFDDIETLAVDAIHKHKV